MVPVSTYDYFNLTLKKMFIVRIYPPCLFWHNNAPLIFCREKMNKAQPHPTKSVCFPLGHFEKRVLHHNWRLGQLMVYANAEQKQWIGKYVYFYTEM